MPASHESFLKKDIIDVWNETLHALDIYTNTIKDHCFDNILDSLLFKINCFINSDNRLTKYDEKIFDYYKNLMWYYSQTITMYKENKHSLADKKVIKILDGLITVLSSQLKQFEDSQRKEYIGFEGNKYDNPIKIEKEMLKNQTYKLFHVLFKKVKYDFGIKYEQQIYILSRTMSVDLSKKSIQSNYYETVEAIYMFILDNIIQELYEVYENTVKNYADKMNNLQVRKATQFYHESIKQEKETLEIIIKVQVSALENEIALKRLPASEVFVIQLILRTLREGYQYLGREIEELVIAFKDAEQKSKVISILSEHNLLDFIKTECFISYLEKLKMTGYSSDIEEQLIDWNFLNNKFIQNLNSIVANEINNRVSSFCGFEGTKNIYNCKKMAVEKVILTDEIISCFKEITDYYIANKIKLESGPNIEIVSGIYETISIKIDSLCENKDIYIDETNVLIKSFVDEKILIDEIELSEIQNSFFSTILENWYKEMITDYELFFYQLFEKLIEDSPLAVYSEKTKRLNSRNEEAISKKIRLYLKEQLLFEMSTFEEIINYSLSKLRETHHNVIDDFVAQIDKIYDKLHFLLKKHNIEQIKPKPYDMFNGKEHEVLMAEKKEKFSRGQVIKLMNCGYKCDGIVIMRANVVAAK